MRIHARYKSASVLTVATMLEVLPCLDAGLDECLGVCLDVCPYSKTGGNTGSAKPSLGPVCEQLRLTRAPAHRNAYIQQIIQQVIHTKQMPKHLAVHFVMQHSAGLGGVCLGISCQPNAQAPAQSAVPAKRNVERAPELDHAGGSG